MKAITIGLASLGFLVACSTSSPVATASPTPSVVTSASSAASPSPLESPSPLPSGTPVARQVLAPATVMPAVDLCSADLVHTANGNVYPLLCQGGSVNVPAWRFYVQVSSNVMSLGRDAALQQIHDAMCTDQSQYHATYVEESSAYELAAAYYGWTLMPEPNCR